MTYFRILQITLILNFCSYLVVAQRDEGAQECPKLPKLSKSNMCRCFHRPNFLNVDYMVDIPSELQNAYIVQKVDFDPDFASHSEYTRAMCIYFGHSATAPVNLTTHEFVIEALNENGWPVGYMKIVPFRDVCKAPFDVRRKHLGETAYHRHHNCFVEASGDDYTDKLYTDTKPRVPHLLHFHNTLQRPSSGVLGYLTLYSALADPTNRPKKIIFLAEAFFSYDNPSAPLHDKTVLVLSDTFDVSYTPEYKIDVIKPSSSQGGIEPSLDHVLQVRDNNPPGAKVCIGRPQPPIPIPVFDEMMCSCFADPRNQETVILPNGTEMVRETLNVKFKIDPFDGNETNVPAKEVLDFYKSAKQNDFVVEPDLIDNLLVVVYPFMPVYKDRSWRQREVVIMALADNGVPIGRWIDPYASSEKTKYEKICDRVFELRKLNWTLPPFPAVQKCAPYDKTIVNYPYEGTDASCYFHFHSDYFFNECVQECKEPKYICAVWSYDSVTFATPPTKEFEFQFILHAVYNSNEQTDSTAPRREWTWMEIPGENKAFFKRSDVWKFTGNSSKWFKRVDHSNEDSDTILSVDYSSKKVMSGENKCVEPATYFMEGKDNDLCLCTFYEDNVGTWQSHYGTTKSLAYTTKPLSEHFRLEIYKTDKDWMVVRVYATPKSILQTHFILHAVYLQAWDQYGIPIGKFEPGFYGEKNSTIANGKPCPKDLFPPSSDPIGNVFKQFNIHTCPRHWGIPEFQPYMIPDANNEPEVFVYKNIWREQKNSEVCAKFLFTVGIRQNYATSIQILAFIRVEDRHPGMQARPSGNAYMIELRSEPRDATDFRSSVPSSSSKQQDVVNKLLPLNYNYFRSTLSVAEKHYKRECIPPAKEPERFFDLCRYYVTTPPLDPQYKHDIDFTLDEYTKTCKSWIDAMSKFTSSHTTTVQLQEKVEKMKPEVMRLKQIKNCFSLKAYKHKAKNSLHVSFRVLTKPNATGNGDECQYFKKNYLREVAIVALNEEGYPIGRSWFRGLGSFKLYNDYVETTANFSKELCLNEDIKLTKEDFEEFGHKMVQDEDKAKCSYGKPGTYYKPNITKYHQDAMNETARPSLFIWSNYRRTLNGFCAHWFFPAIVSATVTPPKFVQFIGSVQILRKGAALETDPFHRADRIFTIRSPKYKFEYNKESGSPNCHGTEADIDSTGIPDADCDCNTTLTPTSKPALCAKLYEHYNHILDSTLYRACYEQIDARLGHEIFELHDCRTKIDYVREPDVFPVNKTILQPDKVNPPENQRLLDKTFDPTDGVFDGCGLIKQCFSKFKELNIEEEKECIKNRSCDVLVTFGKGLGESVRDDEVVIELYAITEGWVAVGISDDKKMGKDYVVECVHEDGNVSLYNSWNIKSFQPTKLSNTNIRMKGKQSYIHNVRPIKTIYYEGRLYCKFYMKIKFSKVDPDLHETHRYQLDQKLIYLVAYSNLVSKIHGEEYGNINTHFEVPAGGESEFGGKEVVATTFYSPKPWNVRLFRMHASFMLIGWMFFISTSIFVARYFKDILVRVKFFKMDCWYFVHIVTSGLALMTIIIASFVEYLGSHGWTNLFGKKFHATTGLGSLVLFVVEIVLGCLIKKGRDGKLQTNMLHRVLGHFVYNLAMLNIALSYRMTFAVLSCDFGVYVMIWIVLYYLLHIFMSFHNKWVSFIMGQSTRAPSDIKSLLLQDFSDNKVAPGHSRRAHRPGDEESQKRNEHLSHSEEEISGRYIRLTALAMYVLVNLVYSLSAVRKAHTHSEICFTFEQVA